MTVATPPSSTLLLGWRDESIRVESEDPAALRWLREFLSPAFGATELRPERSAATIRACIDAARYEELLAAAPAAPAEEIELFTRDGEFERVPCWSVPGAGRVMRDRHAPALYLRSDSAPATWTIVASRSELSVRHCLMRVVRELATTASLRAGELPLHASAVSADGVTLALAGPRRSGKTSLMLHLLGASGVDFVSNDRLMVNGRAGGSPRAIAMPTIITLRPGTLDHAPAIKARLERGHAHAYRTIEECEAGQPPAAALDPPRISAAQLCAAAEVNASAGGALGAVVFPRVDSDADGIEIRRLSEAEAAERWRASLLLASVPERSAAAFDGASPPHRRDGAALDALVRELAARTRCCEARLGPNAFKGSPRRWIDALLS